MSQSKNLNPNHPDLSSYQRQSSESGPRVLCKLIFTHPQHLSVIFYHLTNLPSPFLSCLPHIAPKNSIRYVKQYNWVKPQYTSFRAIYLIRITWIVLSSICLRTQAQYTSWCFRILLNSSSNCFFSFKVHECCISLLNRGI